MSPSVDTHAWPEIGSRGQPAHQTLRGPAGPGRVSRAVSLLLPSLAVVVFAVTLLHVLLVSEGTRSLFRDSDSGWHIRNGEDILARRAVPRVDTYSFTRAGREWFAWEWLSDALLGAVHRAAGLPGIALLAAVAIAASAAAACGLALRLGGNFFLTAAATALLLGATSIHWLARPHLFSWLLSLAFVAAAEFHARRRGWKLYLLPALAALWANVHGSFLLGPAILAIYALGYALRRESRLARDYGVVALLSLGATLANPYGWRLHEHILAYLRNTYVMDRVSEFRSFSFHSPGAWFVEGFLLVAVAGGLLALRRRAYAQALLTFALLHLALYSARHLATAAVVLLPLAVGFLTDELRALPGKRVSAFLDYSERLRALDRKMLGLVPAALALILCAAWLSRTQVGFDPQVFPVRASGFFEGREAGVRLFARDQWGGYLIYRFGGRLKVFVDGRSDFYGRDFLERYVEVADARPGWERVLNEEGVNYVMVRPEQALAQVLRPSARWRVAYADGDAVIFERVQG